jgi:hypothetical protein
MQCRNIGGVEVWLHAFLTLALDGSEWSTSHPTCFTSMERAPNTHSLGRWVGPRDGLDIMAKKRKSLPCQELNPSFPTSSTVTILTEVSQLYFGATPLIKTAEMLKKSF